MALQDPWGYDGKTYSGQEMRLQVAALTGGRGGVGSFTDLVATPQGSPNNTVSVSAGTGIIPATHAGDLGSYEVPNDAALTSPTFAATGANPRWDLLILQVVAGVASLVVVAGTASGSPSYPSLAAFDNYIVICGIKMPASKSIIDNGANGTIDDRRSMWAPYVVCTSATRPPIPFDGQMIEETDTERVYVWDAGNSQWAPSRLFIGTAGQLPAAPKQGTPGYVTDTNTPTGSFVADTTTRPKAPGLYVFDQRWDPPWNLPWGIIDYNEITASTAAFTAETDIVTGHAVTYVANRWIKVTVAWRSIVVSIADVIVGLRIKDGSTQLKELFTRPQDASLGEDGNSFSAVFKPSAAAHTYRMTAYRSIGTGTIQIEAAAGLSCSITVEDLGPAGQPA